MENDKAIEKQAEEILQNTIAEELIKVGYFDQMEKLGLHPVAKRVVDFGVKQFGKVKPLAKQIVGKAKPVLSKAKTNFVGTDIVRAIKAQGRIKGFKGQDFKTRLMAYLRTGKRVAGKHPYQLGGIGGLGLAGTGGLVLNKKEK